MAYKKLSEVTLVESVVEETNVLVEENDEIKRVSASLFKPDYSEIINAPISEDITEEANVLIEEGGEIKRVPKTEVGGGKNEYDAVIRVKMYTDDDDEGVTLVNGDYTTIRDKIMVQQEEPKIKVISTVINYGIWHSVNSTNITVLFHEEDESLRIIIDGIDGYTNRSSFTITWFPDNSMDTEW